MEGFHRNHRRSLGRHKACGGDPGNHFPSFSDGYFEGWQATDSGGRQSTRATISGLPKAITPESGWFSGIVERRGSLEHHKAQRGDEGSFNDEHHGKEAEVWVHLGSARRRGVHLRVRGAERCLVLQLRFKGGRFSRRPRGSKSGANFSTTQKASYGSCPVCGLCNLGPISQEGQQVQQVPEFPVARRRHLRIKMDARTGKLCAMVGVFQSYEVSLLDARSPAAEWIDEVGIFRGETSQQISYLLASGGRRRKQSQAGLDGEAQHQGEAGGRPRRKNTAWMDSSKTLGGDLEHDTGRPRVLARTSSCAGPHMVSQRFKGNLEDPSGGDSYLSIEGWYGGTTPREGRVGGEGEQPSKELDKGKERSKEEKEASRQERVGGTEIHERQRKGWRKVKRRKIIRWGRRVLCLEQQQRCMRRPTPGRTLQRKEDEVASMHHMQESRSSELQVPSEIKLMMMGLQNPSKGKQHGSGEGAPQRKRPLDNKDLGKEDKSKVKKFREPEDDRVEGEEVEFEGEMLSEAKYFTKRIFTFVHHFAGKTDNLSKAIEEEAKAQGVRVSTISVEKENGQNLAEREPYVHHLVSAKRGEIDGYHSGFPCNTYSRLRFREREGLPRPLRTKSFPYGLPGLDQRRKAEVDEGTILMSRSVDIIKAMEADHNLTVKSFYTVENPPESNVEEHISAWEMPELKCTIDNIPEFRKVLFNTCIYQQDQPQDQRMKKPQCFGGNLPNLIALGGFCKCPLNADHLAVVGPSRSRASGEYPKKLCEAYAKLAVQHFIRMGRAEFLEAKRMGLQKNIEEMKAKVEKHREEVGRMAPTTPTKRTSIGEPPGAPTKKRAPNPTEQELKEKEGGASASSASAATWIEGRGKYGMVREGKGNSDIPKNAMYVGGMRNPAKAVRGLPTLENLGKRVNASWQAFVKRHPEALNLAESYGTQEVQVSEQVKEKWKEELKRLTGCRGKQRVVLKEKEIYTTPIDTDLLEAWVRRAGDPEGQVVDWLKYGAPLGIEKKIETSNIFPPVEEGEEGQVKHDIENDVTLERRGFKNYLSVEENKKDAKIELDRYKANGYVTEMDKSEGLKRYKGGTVSRLGLVLKQKEGGEMKRRIVIDLKRSGGNRKSFLPERLVLPRPYDIIGMARELKASTGEDRRAEERGCELVLVDIADAFTTLPLHPEEVKHATSPGLQGDTLLVFRALLFGFRTAPLLYSRFAALIARFLQAISDKNTAAHLTRTTPCGCW